MKASNVGGPPLLESMKRSCCAAMMELGCEARREIGRWFNNQAKNSR
jgi:hypothetical protein